MLIAVRRRLGGLSTLEVESDEALVLLVLSRFERLDIALAVGLVVSKAEVAEFVVALVLSSGRSTLDEVHIVGNTAVQALVIEFTHARLQVMLVAGLVPEELVAHLAAFPVVGIWLARVVGAHSPTVAAAADALVPVRLTPLVWPLTVDAVVFFAEKTTWLADSVKVVARVEDAHIVLRVLTLIAWTVNAVLLEDDDAVHSGPRLVVVALDDWHVLFDGI